MTGILLTLIVIVGTWGTRRHRAAAVPASVALVGLAIGLLVPRSGLFEARFTLFDALLVLAGIGLAAEVIGLPWPIARRIGIGLRSRAWEFDGALYRALAPLNERLNSAPDPSDVVAYGQWKVDTIRFGREIVRRVGRMRAPDSDWSDLRDRYSEVYGMLLDALERGDTSGKAEIRRLTEVVDLQRAALRRKYRAEAAALRHDLPPEGPG